VMDRLRYRTPPCHLAVNNVEGKGVLAVLEFPTSHNHERRGAG